MSHEVETMFSTGATPWHNLGTRVDELLTWAEAEQAAGLDWEVEKRPVLVAAGKGGMVKVPDRAATVRMSDHSVLGIVRPTYKVIQNREVFGWIDDLVDSGEAKYETAGSLRNGRIVWALAHLPQEVEVPAAAGTIRPYLLAMTSHDGSYALSAQYTTVRVECMNTLRLARETAGLSFAIRHTETAEARLAQARAALGIAFRKSEEFAALTKQLLRIKVGERRADEFAALIVPSRRADDEEVATRTLQRRAAILDLFRNSDNLADSRGTGWALYNAVAEYADHAIDYRDSKKASSEENRALAMLDRGTATELKDRALAVILN